MNGEALVEWTDKVDYIENIFHYSSVKTDLCALKAQILEPPFGFDNY